MQKRLLPTALVAALLLTGCSGLRFPGVYRIDIEQGNLVDEAMFEKLRDGMTEAQVRYVMGSPQIVDPFEPGRWVYLYRLRRGNGELVDNRIVLHFADGVLVRREGQPLPASVRNRFDTSQAGSTAPAKPAAAEPAADTAASAAPAEEAATTEEAASTEAAGTPPVTPAP